jgi:hypothetical protein
MSDGLGRPAGEAHLRWDELAVGHVLGGLDQVDRALVREHLAGCPDCRSRVRDLRSVADDLAQAARDEPVKGVGPHEDPDARSRRLVEGAQGHRRTIVTLVALALGLVALLFVAGVAGRDTELVAAARVREATLEALGSGTPAPITLAGGVKGIVVASNDQVAWSLTDLPELGPDEVLVVWLTSVQENAGDSPEITTAARPYGPESINEGRLAGTVLDDTAGELRVTVEELPLPVSPQGRELVVADLAASR